MEYSIIITAWKESRSIKKAIKSLVDKRSGNFTKKEFEIVVVCPDKDTWLAARNIADGYKFRNIRWIRDQKNGKPAALNLAFNEINSEILILTDGDVYIGKNALPKILEYFKDRKVGGVTGRPVSEDSKKCFMEYMGHLLADAAHHKRMVTMKSNISGRSLRFVKKEPGFFVLSGYLFAMRNIGIKVPEDCLIEDAFISYKLHNEGYKLAYEPEAKVFVKYAKNIQDWYKQKLRSVGGYEQLWKYQVIKPETKVRNFWRELEYFWFPIKYSKNLRQFIWSLMLYPLRLILWVRIFWQQRILKRSFSKTWVRIESTK